VRPILQASGLIPIALVAGVAEIDPLHALDAATLR
jgi:hypothetical protein